MDDIDLNFLIQSPLENADFLLGYFNITQKFSKQKIYIAI